ncbi:hypothetical protein JQ581_30120 [Bradyrhizobium liaoningense]|uniref:hypothetical protein n=1 Tax=Bradyrhizobium liaoningense TaxID=43992 RepID=UPI001BAD0584|nr:hypothetical protein [Bradyrhizobium liaoningense]MBR0741197.1 hypothetical protein [Bradyrhizobium liaoningense]
MVETRSLLPDELPPARLLSAQAPRLDEIVLATCIHFRVKTDQLHAHRTVRGLIVILARRYTRVSFSQLAALLGVTPATVCQLNNKMHGRLDANELLRDDRDVIERRLADIVIERSRSCH